MIYITGDTHIPQDIGKLREEHFPVQCDMGKEDYLIICGDFGGFFFDNEEERYWRDWLSQRKFTTLFVDGNHENFDLLNAHAVSLWHGGRVHMISPRIIHLMRGEVYDIEGYRFFSFGGASSIDRFLRTEGKNWWKAEMPAPEEYGNARKNLKAYDYQVDYIITHTAPAFLMKQMLRVCVIDRLNEFFDTVNKRVEYRHWYFGHLHMDRKIDSKHTVLYQQIERIV